MILKKAICLLALFSFCAAVLASCYPAVSGGTDVAEQGGETVVSADTTTAAEITAATEETEPDYDSMSPEELRKAVVERSLITVGNTERAAAALKKAEQGENITVAYIGGSITEGLTAGPEDCWAKLSYNRLCERFPSAQINYVNAGMSGTPSTLGIIRTERDVLSPYGNPDIVFIEFAVNDAQDNISKEAYESLVQRFLGLDSKPAVVLLFTRTSTGYTCQKHMSEIGSHYGLPMISVPDAINPELDSGRMEWTDYSDDGAHPHIEGHKLVAEMVDNYFEKVLSGAESEAKELSGAQPLYGNAYVNMHLLDRTNLTPISLGEYNDEKETISQFPNGWTRKGGENLGISFDITSESLFIIYQCSKSKRFGTAEVYVDGELCSEVKSSSSTGWNNPVAQLVFKSDELKTRRIEIKMAEGNEDTYFGILGFGYTD